MKGVVSSVEVVQWRVSLWMMAMPPPCLLVRSRCAILYLSGVAVVMFGAEAGFSQVSVMKTASGVWVVMVSQISEACLPNERALIRMQ